MAADLLTRAIDTLASGEDLSADTAAAVLAEICSGNATDAQIAAVLIALRTKGETVGELTGLARTMRAFATHVTIERDDLLDVVGTGGGRQTFNISTTAALIAAGAGCAVAKHGNRSATGKSGAADVLEALGVNIDLEPAAVARCVEQIGFGFMFAPHHHAAMRYVIPVRRALAVRTVMNFLGPLTSPAGVTRQLTGVGDRHYHETIAGAFAELGAKHVLIACSQDGLDELSTVAPTDVIEVRDGEITRWTVTAADVGLDTPRYDDLRGGGPEQNAAVTRAILDGERGAPRDIAVLNAGAGIYASGRADTLEAGVRAAEAAIDSGAARETLERYVSQTQELAAA
ncbi:anthranilate phosphoribosyltransferase [Conexibacter sp. CPCC 206217]|uniref:anthranilate phosphoribosyltransferase n=1 Tax=Conexibacter sp. CPCC 206217 TaxID=3064574 RepID=UPI00271F0F0A|nr:anthranilate phosphoribosyltransferase [Conexibacter sp. CPCC 206217]MDO8210977.1 anthranilate phosphoribosyltransferase [Conexibacter sp. CPCC 206217]